MAMLSQKDMVGDQKMLDATGRTPDEWFALLDAEGATAWTHTQIAAWLRERHGSPPWWNQAITVRYEQARGMRAPGQKANGTFTATATRVVDGPAKSALDIASMVVVRELGAEAASVNPGSKAPNARWKLAGRESLLLTATPTKNERTSIGLTHSGIADELGLPAAKASLQNLLIAIYSASEHASR
jgi:hypothetical protein